MKVTISQNLKIILLFAVFLILFGFSILKSYFNIPIFLTGNLASLWYWNYILVGFVSLFYIFKIHKFYPIDFIVAITLGATMSINTGFNPIVGSITVISYYSACSMFRQYNSHMELFRICSKYTLKSVGFGILVAIIPSIFNLAEFCLRDGYTPLKFSISRLVLGAVEALQPGISEEIVFRFFLYAFILNAFNGNIPKTKFVSIMTYFLLIIPHCAMHYSPLDFTNTPLQTVLNLIYMCCVFGIPAVWLLKNKTLYSAISFHWFIDFVRFWIVGY